MTRHPPARHRLHRPLCPRIILRRWGLCTGMHLRFVYQPYRPSLWSQIVLASTAVGWPRQQDGMLTGVVTVSVFLLLRQRRRRRSRASRAGTGSDSATHGGDLGGGVEGVSKSSMALILHLRPAAARYLGAALDFFVRHVMVGERSWECCPMLKPAEDRRALSLGLTLALVFFGLAVEAQTDLTTAFLEEVRRNQDLAADLGGLVQEIESGEYGLIPLMEGRSADLIPGIPAEYQLMYCPECYPGGGVIPGVPRVPPLPVPVPEFSPITPGDF